MDETLDRQVSVRVVRPGHRYTADVVDAARRAALVEDPRLARVLDVGESNGSAYIIAEHLVGRTLEEALVDGPLPAETARRIAGEAAEALDRASVRGLHHLRLTPASVVVGPDGAVKVLGTAVEAALAGVEQDEDPVGADRTDALGLVRVLYAGLTGRWPGPGQSALGAAPRVSGRAVPPGDLVPGVPNDLDTLCTVTLGPHDDGPHSPGDLARQLAPWAASEPLTHPRGLAMGGQTRPSVTAPSAMVSPATAPSATVPPALAPDEAAPAAAAPVAEEEADELSVAPEGELSYESSLGAALASVLASNAAATAAASGLDAVTFRRDDARPGRERSTGPAARHATPAAGVDWSPVTGGISGLREARRRSHAPAADDWTLITGSLPTFAPGSGSAPAPPPDAELEAEPIGPFIPPAPLSRPPRDQTRLVIALVAGLVVLGLVLAVLGLRGLTSSAPLVEPGASTPGPRTTSSAAGAPDPATSPPAATATGGVTPSQSASASPSDGASAEPATIAGIEAIDPEGDGDESGITAVHAIDGAPTTTWRSDRYRSADFGGLKHGLGLYLRLSPGRVTSVKVMMPGSGGTVELRTATGPGLDSSAVVATADAEGGVAVLTPAQPLTGDSFLLWFTTAPLQDSGEHRVVVSEIAVS